MVAVITVSVAAGVGCALAAGVLFEVGYVEQAAGTRQAAGARLTSLLRRPRWVRGSAMVVAGVTFQVGALALAPVSVVQPVLVLGLGLLVVLAERRLGERVGAGQRMALAAAALAVLAIAAGRPEQAGGTTSHDTLAFSVLGAVVVVGLVARRVDPRGRVLAAAVGEGAAVLAAKLALTALPDLLPALGWGALAGGCGLVALQAEMSALRTLPAAVVGPLVLLGQTALPVAVAPLVVAERWRSPVLVLAGLVFASVACILLGRFRQPA